MKTNQLHFSFFNKILAIMLLGLFLLTGCAKKPIVSLEASSEQEYAEIPTKQVPVVAYGRYTLVEVGITPERRNLLNQIIDITIPALTTNKRTTVFDGLHYVLLNSGYSLCENDTITRFKNFELPLAHRRLGPASLKEVLSVLVGPSLQMQVDHLTRQICFIPSQQNPNIVEGKVDDLLNE